MFNTVFHHTGVGKGRLLGIKIMQNNETFEKDIVERVGQLEESKKKCKSAVFKKDTDRKEGQQNKTARRIHVTIYPSVRPLNI